MTSVATGFLSQRTRGVVGAYGLFVLIVATEYGARRIVAPALPAIAARRVNDMLAAGIGYVVLSIVMARALDEPFRSPGVWLAAARRWQAWAGMAAAFATLAIGSLDRMLWGRVVLPSFSLPSQAVVIAPTALWLVPASMLLVNGLIIPIAEEWLWRGLVQPRLVSGLGSVAGIITTAALFSLKHAIVDASLARLLMIVGGGVVLGWVARATSWQTSAVSHVGLNICATAFALLLAPRCLEPQPSLSPQLAGAITHAVALVNRPDSARLEAFFAPDYLARFPGTHEFLRGIGDDAGPCSYSCTAAVENELAASAMLICERRHLVMSIALQAGAPHRATLFAIYSVEP